MIRSQVVSRDALPFPADIKMRLNVSLVFIFDWDSSLLIYHPQDHSRKIHRYTECFCLWMNEPILWLNRIWIVATILIVFQFRYNTANEYLCWLKPCAILVCRHFPDFWMQCYSMRIVLFMVFHKVNFKQALAGWALGPEKTSTVVLSELSGSLHFKGHQRKHRRKKDIRKGDIVKTFFFMEIKHDIFCLYFNFGNQNKAFNKWFPQLQFCRTLMHDSSIYLHLVI